MLHGLLAASGLTLMLYAAFTRGLPDIAWTGLLLLLVAVLGGLVLNLRYHWERRELPVWLVLVHAGVAAAGLVVFALSAWNVDAR